MSVKAAVRMELAGRLGQKLHTAPGVVTAWGMSVQFYASGRLYQSEVGYLPEHVAAVMS